MKRKKIIRKCNVEESPYKGQICVEIRKTDGIKPQTESCSHGSECINNPDLRSKCKLFQ